MRLSRYRSYRLRPVVITRARDVSCVSRASVKLLTAHCSRSYSHISSIWSGCGEKYNGATRELSTVAHKNGEFQVRFETGKRICGERQLYLTARVI